MFCIQKLASGPHIYSIRAKLSNSAADNWVVASTKVVRVHIPIYLLVSFNNSNVIVEVVEVVVSEISNGIWEITNTLLLVSGTRSGFER